MGVNSIMNDAGRIGFVVKGTYDNTATYDFLDVIYYNNATYVAKKLTVGNEPQSSSEFWQVLVAGEVDFNDVAPTFLQAKTRENINSGEKLPVLFGKIKKWYTDLKAVAFSGSYNDLSDTPSIPAAVAVKGNAESSYRTGNVNLTPANIGAVPTANVLDSKESITANTASGNVAGALGTKEINANLQSQIDTLNSNLNNVTNRICSIGTSKWVDCPIGISMYHYEGNDTTNYNIPSPFVEILTIRYAAQRGIAFAVDWRGDQPHQLWVNVLHDTWKSWVEK